MQAAAVGMKKGMVGQRQLAKVPRGHFFVLKLYGFECFKTAGTVAPKSQSDISACIYCMPLKDQQSVQAKASMATARRAKTRLGMQWNCKHR